MLKVAARLAQGERVREAARAERIDPTTVSVHIGRLKKQLGCRTSYQLFFRLGEQAYAARIAAHLRERKAG